MRLWVTLLGSLVAFLLVGCEEKPTEVEISETRELTSRDSSPKLFATSEERFEGGRPIAQEEKDPSGVATGAATVGSVKGETPEGWKMVEGSSMRLLNFAVGPNGEAEAYLTKSRGGVAANVTRWMRQFDATDVDPANMPKGKLGSLEGVVVEAKGRYSPGMGRAAQDGQALVGLIAESSGTIWTLKMTGPQEIVAAQREPFLSFAESLELPE